jgi:hypothetical protein
MNMIIGHGLEGSSPSAFTNEINILNKNPDIDRRSRVGTVLAKRLPQALADCACHLTRLRASHPEPLMISTLIEQCKEFDSDPDAMRPKILRTIKLLDEGHNG